MKLTEAIQTDNFVYRSSIMKQLYFEIKRCARLANSVLLVGESGVGKDKVAFEIHRLSPRKNKPYLCVPIHSLSDTLIESELFGYEKGAFSGADHSKAGRFEATDGGTIYLPEISELSESIQLKLLYFLQYRSVTRIGQSPYKPAKEINVRLVFATNENIENLVEQGKIRTDFYHRINIIKLEIPPLRNRIEDIEPLTKYFVDKFANQFFQAKIKIDPSVYKFLQNHDWPGNIRELENIIERVLISIGDRVFESTDQANLTVDDFSNIFIRNGNNVTNSNEISLLLDSNEKLLDYKTAQLNFKKEYFTTLLHKAKGNIRIASKISNLTPQGLRKILKQNNINNSDKLSEDNIQ